MRRIGFRLAALASIFALTGCSSSNATSGGSGSSKAPNVTPQGLSGTWKSVACESNPDMTSNSLTFQFTEARWSIDVDAFGGPGCLGVMKAFTIHMEGPYELGARSPVVEGAREGKFTADIETITPTAIGAQILKAKCPDYAWSAGTAQDITKKGCLTVHPTSECPAEYDLVAFVGDVLYFGDRSQSLCVEQNRPKRLGSLGFARITTPG